VYAFILTPIDRCNVFIIRRHLNLKRARFQASPRTIGYMREMVHSLAQHSRFCTLIVAPQFRLREGPSVKCRIAIFLTESICAAIFIDLFNKVRSNQVAIAVNDLDILAHGELG